MQKSINCFVVHIYYYTNMTLYQFFIILLIHCRFSIATQIFYVLPDDSTNVSCPSQPCATLSQYLLDNNDTLPVVSNVEYHFLPGEHHVPNVILKHLCNFTIIGIRANNSSPVLLVLVDRSVLRFHYSSNVTVANLIFKYVGHVRSIIFKVVSAWVINTCYSCYFKNIILLEFELTLQNLIGESYLTNISINITKAVNLHGIELYYNSKNFTGINKVEINHISVSGHVLGILIVTTRGNHVVVMLRNSLFYKMDAKILKVRVLLASLQL